MKKLLIAIAYWLYRLGGGQVIKVNGVMYSSTESYLSELNRPIQYDYTDFLQLENTITDLKKVIDGRDALLAKYKSTIRSITEQAEIDLRLHVDHVERKETIVMLRQQLIMTNKALIQRTAEFDGLAEWFIKADIKEESG